MVENKFEINMYSKNITIEKLENHGDNRSLVIIATRGVGGTPVTPLCVGRYCECTRRKIIIEDVRAFGTYAAECTGYYNVFDLDKFDSINSPYAMVLCFGHTDPQDVVDTPYQLLNDSIIGGYVVKFECNDDTTASDNLFLKEVIKYEFDMDKLTIGGAYKLTFLDTMSIFDDVYHKGDNINILLAEKYPDRLIFVRLVNQTNQFGRVYSEAFVVDPNMKVKLECLGVAIPG